MKGYKNIMGLRRFDSEYNYTLTFRKEKTFLFEFFAF